jgi:hypothetical protein
MLRNGNRPERSKFAAFHTPVLTPDVIAREIDMSDSQGVQRIVLTASRSEPVREPKEVFFVDCIKHLDHCTLNDLIFQCGDPQRALPPV